MLSLYIIPCDNPLENRPEETEKSFGDVVTNTVVLGHRRLYEVDEKINPYYCYMFSNEVIDEQLRESIPIFLKTGIDYFVLYRRRLVGDNNSFFISPRIFKAGILLCEDVMLPTNQRKLSFIKILDGWICNAPNSD